jgi:hypothetical protein
MKNSRFKLLVFLISMTFVLNGCHSDEDNSNSQKASILGSWQMYSNTTYGLDFTNFGIVKWKHKPHVDSELDYVQSGNTLIVSEKAGIVIFSNSGNTITVSGFSDPNTSGAEGSVGPYINGVYIRQ